MYSLGDRRGIRNHLAAALAVVVAAACSPPPTRTVFTPPAPGDACVSHAPPRSLDDVWAAHLGPGCLASGCHADGAGALSFATPHQLWAATAGVAAHGDPALPLVTPGAPGASYLYLRLKPTLATGAKNPHAALDDAGLAELAGWICGGAPEPIDDQPVPRLGAVGPPDFGVAGAPLTLALAGDGFTARSQVKLTLGGDAPINVATRFANRAALAAVLPATLVAGDWLVSVTNPSPVGGTSTALPFHLDNPAPALATIAPAQVAAGSADFALTVTGAGFVASSQVLIDGAAAATTFVDARTLHATVPAAAVSALGPVAVNVVNAAPGGGQSQAATLAVVNPAPAITALTPASVTAGQGALALDIAGTGFVATTTLLLDGAPLASTPGEGGHLAATVPASTLAVGAAHAVTATTPAPGGGASAAATLTVTNPAPHAASLSPASVAQNGAAFTLTVAGTGFVPVSQVLVSGQPRPTTFVSATALSAALPETDLVAVGTLAVTVTSPAPGGGASERALLTVFATPRPTITGLDAGAAPGVAGSGAPFTLAVSGSGYLCAAARQSSVLVGGNASSIASCSATRLVATVPAEAPGALDVVVQNFDGKQSDPATLTVVTPNAVPALSGLAPAKVGTGAAFALDVTGASFVSGAQVLLGGGALPTTFVSATELTATSPAVAGPASLAVVVKNPAPGGGTSAAQTLSVVTPNPAPALSSLTPHAVAAGSSATVVTASGAGFVAGVQASLDGAARPAALVDAHTVQVSLTATDVAAGGVHVVAVSTPAPGGGTASLPFEVVAVTALAPQQATVGDPAFTLTVAGAGFEPASVVSFGARPEPTTFVSATKLTAAVPASDLGSAARVTVTVAPATTGPAFELDDPAPALSAVTPASVVGDSGAQSVTLAGSGFVAASVARAAGSARATHFLSSTQLAVDLLSGDIADTGAERSLALDVVNPAPGGGASGTQSLGITVPPPPTPTLTPCGAVAGDPDVPLTLGGSYPAGATVTFNGTALAATASSGGLSVTVPRALLVPGAGNFANVVVSTAAAGPSAPAFFGVASQRRVYADVTTVFANNCTTCHAPGGSGPMSLLAADARGNLVGVPATGFTSDPKEQGILRVRACEALKTRSLLVDVLESSQPAIGNQMPESAQPLNPTTLQIVIDWIAEGAPGP